MDGDVAGLLLAQIEEPVRMEEEHAKQERRCLPEALSLYRAGALHEAAKCLDAFLRIRPRHFEALHLYGVIACQLGQAELGAVLIGRAIEVNPHDAGSINDLGNAFLELKRPQDAIEAYNRALALSPNSAAAHINRGNALKELGRSKEALEAYSAAISIQPSVAEAYCNRAALQLDLDQTHCALADYEEAAALAPEMIEARYGCGLALYRLERFHDALTAYDAAINLRGDHAPSHNGRGLSLRALRRLNEALGSFEKAIALRPDHREALYNRGLTFYDLGQARKAIEAFDRAIALRPNHAEAILGRGLCFRLLGDARAALECFQSAYKRAPHTDYLAGALFRAYQETCHLAEAAEMEPTLVAHIMRGDKAALPWITLGLVDSPSVQLRAAEIFTGAMRRRPRAELSLHVSTGRLRIGYFSPDFRSHPVMEMLAGVLEQHDKDRFETIAFSFVKGPANDPMRARVQEAFHEFLDVDGMSDDALVALSRRMGVDIAVDLAGFTNMGRPEIFHQRVAPIQVGCLGYAGTMGHGLLDYLIADRTILPRESRSNYPEKIVLMPDCFMPGDRRRLAAGPLPSRVEAGLPEDCFVFCGFNNIAKINQSVFHTWMRILAAVEGSVLWLTAMDEYAIGNLRKEAARRGVDPMRLVFAERVPTMAQHVARQQLADLFLDTLPYNAHSTAMDALSAGLPVLTQIGESYAARVTASLLTTLELPELIVTRSDAYEARAIELARNPPALLKIRKKIMAAHRKSALFDTARYTRNLESAFTAMAEQRCFGCEPSDIDLTGWVKM